MNRRQFLRAASLISLSILVPSAQGWAYTTGNGNSKNKKLVVIFLRGAVDGINVVVPYGDSRYYDFRPTIAIGRPGEDLGVVDLDGHFGLHPALEPLIPFWKQGSMAFIHSCGSPDPSRSHFDAQDYMESGMPGVRVSSTGWMNRLLIQLPDNHSPVRALNFGPTIPRILEGPASVANVSLGNRAGNTLPIDRPVIGKAFEQMYSGTDSLSKAFQDGMQARKTINSQLDQEMVMANQGAPLPRAGFGSQLAKLITKDPTIQLAFLAFGGWDTHVNQGAGKGQLANHLSALGKGLVELINGLGPLYKDTTIVVMSEFGRTAHENGNGGTDHGHGNVMMVLGGNIAGKKVYGHWAGLSNLYEGRDLPVSTDFRSVISTVVTEHLGLAGTVVPKLFPSFAQNQLLTGLVKS